MDASDNCKSGSQEPSFIDLYRQVTDLVKPGCHAEFGRQFIISLLEGDAKTKKYAEAHGLTYEEAANQMPVDETEDKVFDSFMKDPEVYWYEIENNIPYEEALARMLSGVMVNE